MDEVELVREEKGKLKRVVVDVCSEFRARARYRTPQGWDVEFGPPQKSEKKAEADAKAMIAKLRAEGWKDKSELASTETARVDAKHAANRAEADADEDAHAAKLAAFPTSALEKKLAAVIAKPKGVTKLELRGTKGNTIKILPPAIKALKDLKSLILDDNDLEGFPDELSHLKALEHLSVARNKLIDMRPACYIKALTYFDVRDNQLTEALAGNFQKDFEIQMSGNALEQLGWFKNTRVIGIDTDALFPIGDRCEKPWTSVQTIELHGRAPTDAERAEAAKWFPKAKLVVIGSKKTAKKR